MTDTQEKERQAFFESYCERSGVTVDFMKEQGFDAYPCTCGLSNCSGWQVVSRETYEREKSLGLVP